MKQSFLNILAVAIVSVGLFSSIANVKVCYLNLPYPDPNSPKSPL